MASNKCWHCNHDSHMSRRSDAYPAEAAQAASFSDVWFAFFQCDFCGYGVIGKLKCDVNKLHHQKYRTNLDRNDRIYVNEATGYANDAFDSLDADIEWLPDTVLGKEYEDVDNQTIRESASEAHSDYSIRSYRSSVLMARAVVEAIAKDKGIVDGTLQSKIEQMQQKNIILPSIKAQADEIRLFGNDMAHGDFANPISADDAHEVLNFLDVLIDFVYQTPTRLEAMSRKREERKQSSRQQQ